MKKSSSSFFLPAAVAATLSVGIPSAFAGGPDLERAGFPSYGRQLSDTSSVEKADREGDGFSRFASPSTDGRTTGAVATVQGVKTYAEGDGYSQFTVKFDASTVAEASHSSLPCAIALSDGSTLHVFPNGKMGMENRYGNASYMKAGEVMKAADGTAIIMNGNEVQQTDILLRGSSRG